ncbi:MAG: hypothetical protein AMQ22_02076 [Candidatus Methanofastidiosum methylothiophilum]|uniref:Uncharacterized protein n=1 Tax=Candidatus Methanofastidiosum methylothiophilum TaxID=1705564 RepID=A0A150INR3_9EURY|nr:MAG: hypothetical protein AMQ22_02076 [Candidatus Methanofastidiosum methylthiophilus]
MFRKKDKTGFIVFSPESLLIMIINIIMIIMSRYTTISVKPKTLLRLKDVMKKSDDYDSFINKLIDKWRE